MDSTEDILVELSEKDLEKLVYMYEIYRKMFPYIYSFLHICLKSKRNGMNDFVQVFSPNGFYEEDGTFIASMPNHGHDIVLHSFDPTGKRLIEGLSKTNRFKYLRDPARPFTLFYGVAKEFYPKILNLLANEQNHEILDKDVSNVWVLDTDNFWKNKATEVSHEEVYVKQIEEEDFSVINANWQHNYPESEKKLLDLFKLIKGSGVYLKSNDQLVSWVVCSRLGQMAALTTLEEHKSKGYAGLAVRHMANTLAREGRFVCCGLVHPENIASARLLFQLGFKKKTTCHYISVHNKY